MTREEAIKELKTRYLAMSQCLDIKELHKSNEALDIAIKALEQEPILDKIKAEYKARLIELISMAVRVKHNTESIDVLIDILDILISEVEE